MDEILEKAFEKSVYSLKKSFSRYGLFASGGKNGYKGVWARDSMISLLGASLIEDKKDKFKKIFKKSLITLGNAQSDKGQIPNAVHSFDKGKEINYLSIDSSLWYIIGHYIYESSFNDSRLFNKYKSNINKAYTWLTYQDMGEDLMLEQLPTTDWQDAFPHKYGRVLSTQALYYKVLKLLGKEKIARTLKNRVNNNKEYQLWNGSYYYAYRWKNHNRYKEIGDFFDSFGNLFAIISGLATKQNTKKILSYIEKNKIDKPYPVKSIYPPITKDSRYWQDYYLDCEAKKPYHYSNAGIWPFLGGFYILALIKDKQFKKAKQELKSLAKSNTKGNLFPEWINPKTKETHGIYQAWSAGMYILAYSSLHKNRVLNI